MQSPWNTDIFTYGRERRRGRRWVKEAVAAGDRFVVSSLGNAEETVRLGADPDKVHRIVCAVDCGQAVNPTIVVAQVESAILFGLSATLWGEINVQGGRVQQSNFHDYRVVRMNEVPVIETHLVASDESPGGIGEPATALVAPAICNAIHAATGRRLRSLPLTRHNLA